MRTAVALSPKHKLLLASALLVALMIGATVHGANAALVARITLGVAALGGLSWWIYRAKQNSAPARLELPRLSVSAKASLSPRCSVALVQAEGVSYLVAFGDGFAQIQTAPRIAVKARRGAPQRKARRIVVSGGAR